MTTAEKSDIVQQAETIYEARIRSRVEADHHGEFVAVDVDSGDYEVNKDLLEATQRLRARRPAAVLFGIRIGYAAAYAFGGSLRPS